MTLSAIIGFCINDLRSVFIGVFNANPYSRNRPSS